MTINRKLPSGITDSRSEKLLSSKSLDRYLAKEGRETQHGDLDLHKAKKADLITFPEDIDAVNCANCIYSQDDYCRHPMVDQELKSGAHKMCCNYWDAPDTKREWEEGEY